MPLVGTYLDDGQRYLFVCLAGRVDRFNVWAYAQLAAEEAAFWLTRTFESEAELASHLVRALDRRSITLAFAADEAVMLWNEVEVEGDLATHVSQFVDDIVDHYERIHRDPRPTFDGEDPRLIVA